MLYKIVLSSVKRPQRQLYKNKEEEESILQRSSYVVKTTSDSTK
jgi:hypothetical protein